MSESTVDAEVPGDARRMLAWREDVVRRVRRDGFACIRLDGQQRIVVESYTDGFNLVSGHGIPVRLAMLRGLLYGVREAMRDGPLGEDYRDLYGIWCGLHVLREVVKRKKLVWGSGDQLSRNPALLSDLQPPRLLSRTKSRARKKGGELDLLSLVPWELRPFDFHEVSVPSLILRAQRRAHRALFLEGPTIAAHHLHLAIVGELHISYSQEWSLEQAERCKFLLARNRPVKIGERELVYRTRDLAQLLAFYGVGRPASVNQVRRYRVDYWNLEVLRRFQARARLLDLRTIPWMRERYLELGEFVSSEG